MVVNLSKVSYSVVSWVRVPLRWALLNTLFLLSSKTVIGGIEVIDVAEVDVDQTLRRLREALDVIRRTDVRRYERMRRDLRRIVLMKAGVPQFASEVGACLIRSAYVREKSAEAVATTLVHEAVHARIHRRGVGYGPGLRIRVEEVCVKQQIDFARALGNPEILSHLTQVLKAPLWVLALQHEDTIAALRSLGVPEWMLRLYDKVAFAMRRHT